MLTIKGTYGNTTLDIRVALDMSALRQINEENIKDAPRVVGLVLDQVPAIVEAIATRLPTIYEKILDHAEENLPWYIKAANNLRKKAIKLAKAFDKATS